MKKSINLSHIKNKSVLFLQAPVGEFFNEINDKLLPFNDTYHIIFNKGDDKFSRIKNKIFFTDKFEYFDSFIELIYQDLHIDYIFLIGDCRILHKKAIKIAKNYGIDIYVFEEGYLRPNFITMEQNGVNFNSKTFPKNSNIYKTMHYENTYMQNIHKKENEVILTNINFKALVLSLKYYYYMNFDKQYFKNYIHHRNKNMLKEFKYFLLTLYKKNKYQEKEKKIIEQFINKERYFFIPLQLDADMQIQYHSKYNNMFEFLDEVLLSFSKHNNKELKLIIKQHPLGLGHVDYEQYINNKEKELGIEGRILFIRTGSLGAILKNSLGVVVVNSTVGLSTLYHLKPLKVLGKANYDIEGITYKDYSLEEFWNIPREVDKKLIGNFLNYLYEKTQYYGSFYIKNTIDIIV